MLEQDLVDVAGLKFATAEPVDRFGSVRQEFGALGVVVDRYRLTRLPTILFGDTN